VKWAGDEAKEWIESEGNTVGSFGAFSIFDLNPHLIRGELDYHNLILSTLSLGEADQCVAHVESRRMNLRPLD
jgi:hypothetical protein